jgi:hypothetical protein
LAQAKKLEELNVLVLTARVERPPTRIRDTSHGPVCDVGLFVPNGIYKSFKITASVFGDRAFTRAAELRKGMDVLFAGHLRGFRQWQEENGQWRKSWYSGTGDIIPASGLPDISQWPRDPLTYRPAELELPPAVPVLAGQPEGESLRTEAAVATLVPPERQLELAGGSDRRGRYGDAFS